MELILTDNVENINVAAWDGARGYNTVPSYRFKAQHDVKRRIKMKQMK